MSQTELEFINKYEIFIYLYFFRLIILQQDHHIEKKDKSEIDVVVLPKQSIISWLKQVQNANSDTQKFEIARNLEACIEAYDWTSLIKYVDIETCLGLKKQIQSNKATVRQRLVRVVMAIVERGADGPYSEGKNQFYYPILKSDLDDEIKEIVRQLFQKYHEQWSKTGKIPLFFKQAVITLLYFYSNQRLSDSIQQYSQFIFTSHINTLIQDVNEYKKKKFDAKSNEQISMSDEFERDLILGVQMMKALQGVSFSIFNWNGEENGRKQISQQISNLLHLHCPKELKCQHNIHLIESTITQNLLGYILEFLSNTEFANEYLKIQSKERQSIFKHIELIVIQNTSRIPKYINKLYKIKQHQNKQMSSSLQLSQISDALSTSIQVLFGAVNLLKCLIQQFFNLLEKVILGNRIGFALVDLMKFDVFELGNVIDRRNMNNIQDKCNECMEYILLKCENKLLLKNMIKWKFLSVIIEKISICGETSLNNKKVYNGLEYIKLFILKFQSYKINEQSKYLPIFKQFEVQFEEFGGLEEIEAHQFKSSMIRNGNIYYETILLIDEMINSYDYDASHERYIQAQFSKDLMIFLEQLTPLKK